MHRSMDLSEGRCIGRSIGIRLGRSARQSTVGGWRYGYGSRHESAHPTSLDLVPITSWQARRVSRLTGLTHDGAWVKLRSTTHPEEADTFGRSLHTAPPER